MAAEIELIVGLVEVSRAQNDFRLVVALKSGPRNDIEYPICTVALVRGITAALHFEVVDVLGIKLRPQIAGDVCIRNLYAIDQPAYLVSAADVKLIVGHVSAGSKVSNHCQAVAPISPGRLRNVHAAYQCSGRHRIQARSFRVGCDRYRGLNCRNLELEMYDRSGAGHDRDLLLGRCKPRLRGRNHVISHRHGGEGEFAILVRLSGLRPVRCRRLQVDHSASNGAVLWVMDNSLDRPKHRSVHTQRKQHDNGDNCQQSSIHLNSLHATGFFVVVVGLYNSLLPSLAGKSTDG